MLAKLNDNWGLFNPWRTMSDLHKEFLNLFDEFGEGLSRYRANYPRMTLTDGEKDIRVQFAMPGYDKHSLEVEVLSDFLNVRADRKEPKLEKDEKYLHRERSFGKFEESIKLPAKVKAGNAKAKFSNGILEIKLPKQDAEKPLSIKVAE
ncbi:MAG: Hsp20/alpha crystallin family protein [Lentisphaerae bacterium]|nr:Hsp20/alpha crystallin family protein [Lentisphaerota bacterium]MCP4101001.1 Hsp20/alpha crystallin family protein [Lentisphaerota bacterium]